MLTVSFLSLGLNIKSIYLWGKAPFLHAEKSPLPISNDDDDADLSTVWIPLIICYFVI